MRYGVALSPISRYAVVDARQYPDDGFAAIAEGTAASVSHRAERLCGKSLRLHPGVFARAAALSKWGYDGVVAHDLANPQATGTASAGSSGSEANTVRVSGVDKAFGLAAVLGLLGISLILQHEVSTQKAILFLVGAGLGVSLFRSLIGCTGGWRRFIREGRSDAVRSQLLLLALLSVAFFPIVGAAFPDLQASAALGPVSLSVLIGAFIFGFGMQLGGGCGSGTLFTAGSGNVKMVVTLIFFIVGATIGSMHLPAWLELPNLGRISSIQTIGWETALGVQLVVIAALYLMVRRAESRRWGDVLDIRAEDQPSMPFMDRLLFGPWPLLWGVIGIAVFSLLTLVIAGHPWSITFALGLWGTKIAGALGFDVANWTYWSSGYPAIALQSSVLQDTTSVMDFGVIFGALLAAAIAGRFAISRPIKLNALILAVIGGLMLGYGARLAFGCNIGGLLAGTATGSMHGWLWLLAGFTGTWLGVYARVWFGLDAPMEKKHG